MTTVPRAGVLLAAGVWASTVAVGQSQGAGAAAPVIAESFGPGVQELFIGAAAFQHTNNRSGYEIDWTTDGYLNYDDESFLGVFVAPLVLPVGAEISMICTYFLDTSLGGNVTTWLDAVRLGQGGVSPGVVPVFGPVGFDTTFGYDVACSESSYTFRNAADLDGDGYPESLVHRLRVEMSETGEGRVALGGVNVVWRRHVSPAPATPSFGDVPVSHPFFQFIEALAASGITAGYGNGNYGVNDPITRGQMAVFLSKALGLHWGY